MRKREAEREPGNEEKARFKSAAHKRYKLLVLRISFDEIISKPNNSKASLTRLAFFDLVGGNLMLAQGRGAHSTRFWGTIRHDKSAARNEALSRSPYGSSEDCLTRGLHLPRPQAADGALVSFVSYLIVRRVQLAYYRANNLAALAMS